MAYDAVIIGGGVLGLTTARRLAGDNLNVALLERHASGTEASWAGAGILAPPQVGRSDVLAQFLKHSLNLYPDFCAELADETGIDPQYERCGEVQLAFTDEWVTRIRAEADSAARDSAGESPACRFLDRDALRQAVPRIGPDARGALLYPQTAAVRNPRLLKALRKSCQDRGVDIREHTPATGLVRDGHRVVGAQHEHGTFQTKTVVLCAGTWSSRIDPGLARLVPVLPVRGQMILLRFPVRPLKHVLSASRKYLVPRSDGHVLLGATEEPEAGFDKRNTPVGMEDLIAHGLRFMPEIADAVVVASWAGLRPGTPDERPFLGHVPGYEGLVAATGHLRTGLSLAPATAEFVSDLINVRSFPLDLHCCAPGRPDVS